MQIPKQVLYIINTLENSNFEGFIVGGCVRDYILGFVPKDFDITTDAMPENIKALFDHTIDTGIEHGTVTVVIDKQNFEVTTYRIDGEYKDNRRPENVIFSKKIEEDLSRRDFTINAIAYNHKKGFIDPFYGKNDIENRIIRGVGNADTRFKEDALRMMRAIRFANQLGFDIEEDTFIAIKDNAHLIENISIERTRDEFLKLIKSDYIDNLYLLEETGLYKYFFNEIAPIFKDYKRTVGILKTLNKELRLYLILAFLEKEKVEPILKRLKLDNKTIKEAKTITNYITLKLKDDSEQTRRLMSMIEPDILKKILQIRFAISLYDEDLVSCKTFDNIFDEIDETIRKNHCYNLKTLAINGEDLKQIGIKDGKKIGSSLKFALDYVLSYPEKNTKDTLLKYIGDNYESINNRS